MSDLIPIEEFDADLVEVPATDLVPLEDFDSARLAVSATATKGVNPDQFAEARTIGAQYGIPADVVGRNLEQMKQRALQDTLTALPGSSPVLATQMSNPDFAKVAQDDIDNLSAVEKTLQVGGRAGHAVASAPFSLSGSLYHLAALPLDVASALVSPLLGDANPFAYAAEQARTRADEQFEAATAVQGDRKGAGLVEQAFYSGLQSVTEQAPFLIASGISGSPAPALYGAALSTGGRSYGTAKEKGVDTATAALYGVSDAAVEWVTEKLPILKGLEGIDMKAGLVKTIISSAPSEVIGEQAATVLQDFNEWAVLHPESTVRDFVEARPGAAAQTLIATLVGATAQTTTMYAAAKAADAVTQKRSKAEDAGQGAQMLQQVNELAAASKLAARSPGDFANFVQTASAEGLDQVYVTGEDFAKALNQSGITLQEAARVSPAVADQASEAATGGVIRIPLGEFASKFGNSELGAALTTVARFSPDGMNQVEAQAFIEQQGQAFRRLADSSLEEAEQRSQTKQEADRVRAYYAEQLAGHYGTDARNVLAQGLTAMHLTLAQRAGMTPEEFGKQFPLRVETAPAGKRIDAAGGTVPETTPSGQAEATAGLSGEASPPAPPLTVAPTESGRSDGRDSTLSQPGKTEPRAGFTPGANLITLFQTADLSSVLHEAAHFYLEVLADVASREGAPEGLRADMDAALRWFGVDSLATWKGMTLDQKRAHHEQWAEGFEQYLFEGKAPTPELQSIFSRFRAWLASIYKSIREIGPVALNDEIRGVFDRLLATDEQIAAAKADPAFAGMFKTAEEAGATAAQFAAYQALSEAQIKAAEDAVSGRLLRDMQWLENARGRVLRGLQKQAREFRATATEEARRAVESRPVYQALRFLRTGKMLGAEGEEIQAETGHRLSIPALQALYANQDGAPDWKSLKGATGKEGLPPDLVADMFGFPSGDALVRELVAAPPIADAIRAETDRIMLERHGDITSPQALEQAVQDALANDAHERFVATELSFLEKAGAKTRELMEAARRAARSIIDAKRVREISPRQYVASESRLADQANQALARGDRKQAAQYKRQQLLQVHLTRAAFDAQEEIEKAQRAFGRILRGTDENVAKSRDLALVQAARAILGLHGVGTRTEDALAYLDKVRSYDPAMAALLEPALNRARAGGDYRDMTLDEFRTMRDAVQSLWAVSKTTKEIEIDGKRIDRAEVVMQLQAELATHGTNTRAAENRTSTDADRNHRALLGAGAWLRRVESFLERVGPYAKKVIGEQIFKATTAYRVAQRDYLKRYLAELEKIRPGMSYSPIVAPELNGFVFSNGKAEVLHALLHTGNASNKRKLMLGYRGWGILEDENGRLHDAPFTAFRDRLFREGVLTKADMDFVQATWDLLEELKPKTQAAFKEMYGRYFDEITAEQVVTPVGTYRGGYVPAKTDPLKATEGQRNEDSILAPISDVNAFPTAGTGATKSRIENYAEELQLDLKSIPAHIDWALKFSFIQPRVLDAYRLLKDHDLAASLRLYSPAAFDEMLKPWLQRTATQTTEIAPHGATARKFAKVVNGIRRRAALGIMTGNVVNALQNYTSITALRHKIPKRHIAHAAMVATMRPQKTAEAMTRLSKFMDTRVDTQLYEIAREIEDITLKVSTISKFRDWAVVNGYILSRITQHHMDRIAWTGAFNDAMERNPNDEAAAVQHADSVVRQTQGSQNPEDISRLEAAGPFAKLFTMFAGWFNTQANLQVTSIGKAADAKRWGTIPALYLAGFAIPAILGELVAASLRGTLDLDSDDDGEWDFIGLLMFSIEAQAKYLSAFVPGVGSLGMAVFNAANSKPYDDRVMSSPAVSAGEAMARTMIANPVHYYETGEIRGRDIKDALTALTLITGFPFTLVARPLAYEAEVARGKAYPEDALEHTRGLISGSVGDQ